MLVSRITKDKGDRLVTARPEDTIATAAKTLKRERIGAVMVVDERGELAGILSERDIVRAMPEHGPEVFGLTVEQLMTREVVTCGPGDQVHEIMKSMTSGRFRHIPVKDDGRLVGIISIGDVVKSRLQELETETSQLRDYIAG